MKNVAGIGKTARLAVALAVLTLTAAAALAQGSPEAEYLTVVGPAGRPGGRLVVALRAEPTTLNPALVSPNILAGAAAGLGNFRPAILDHYTLWKVDELYWRSQPGE